MTRLICPKCGSVLSDDWCNDCGIEISKPIVEKKMQTLICPNCSSENIAQYRMLTGAIWCDDCGLRAEHKEKFNPFLVEQPNVNQVLFVILANGYCGIYVNDKLIAQGEYSTSIQIIVTSLAMELNAKFELWNLNTDLSKYFNEGFPISLTELTKNSPYSITV